MRSMSQKEGQTMWRGKSFHISPIMSSLKMYLGCILSLAMLNGCMSDRSDCTCVYQTYVQLSVGWNFLFSVERLSRMQLTIHKFNK